MSKTVNNFFHESWHLLIKKKASTPAEMISPEAVAFFQTYMPALARKVVYSFWYWAGSDTAGKEEFHIVLILKKSFLSASQSICK